MKIILNKFAVRLHAANDLSDRELNVYKKRHVLSVYVHIPIAISRGVWTMQKEK